MPNNAKSISLMNHRFCFCFGTVNSTLKSFKYAVGIIMGASEL